MRDVVLGMMTTLNGRLDDPAAWVAGVPDDLYAELDRLYGTFDTILVGHTTYEEMVEYWPGAEDADDTPDAGRSMARKMNSYKKYVFTRAEEKAELEWNNAEPVLAHSDDEIVGFISDLKAQPGKDIHLSGGAELAQTLVRLGLVDRFHFVVHPVFSPGAQWYDGVAEQRKLALVSSTSYSNGVVGSYYEPRED